ncbi:MAG: molybdenum cofactor guanylyltransferase [Gammaproteobacteria bacterium]|nr:molybdenum cofactor guanylyltransferase [Gammaproteobacteria bacterium]
MPCVKNNLKKTTAGIILAGGQSSRMGRNKALLPYRNGHLIDHTIHLLHQSGLEHYYVSGHLTNYPCIPDQVANRGPLGGLYSVFMAAQLAHFSHFLVLPVDMPQLTSALLTSLIQEALSYDIICYEGYPLPLVIKNSDTVKQQLEKKLTFPSASIKGLLATLSTQYIALPETQQEAFLNINTPLAWKKFLTTDHGKAYG